MANALVTVAMDFIQIHLIKLVKNVIKIVKLVKDLGIIIVLIVVLVYSFKDSNVEIVVVKDFMGLHHQTVYV